MPVPNTVCVAQNQFQMYYRCRTGIPCRLCASEQASSKRLSRMESARNNDGGGGVNARRTGPLRPPLGTGDAATAAAVSSSSSDSDPQLSPSATTPDSAFAVSSSSSSTPSTSPSALLPVVGSDAMAFGDTAIGLFDESGVLDVLTDLGFLDALDRDEGSASLLLASQNGLDVDGSSCDADVRVGEKKHMSTSFSARGVPVSASEPQDRKKRGQTAGQLKRIRKCVKRELEYLQVQVHDLEEQLAVLRRTRAATAVDSVDPTTATMAPVAQPGGMWERIARNQLHEKKESEEENAKLRELLERQIKVANALARVLKKSPDVSVRPHITARLVHCVEGEPRLTCLCYFVCLIITCCL